jgi:hypothetical protein
VRSNEIYFMQVCIVPRHHTLFFATSAFSFLFGRTVANATTRMLWTLTLRTLVFSLSVLSHQTTCGGSGLWRTSCSSERTHGTGLIHVTTASPNTPHFGRATTVAPILATAHGPASLTASTSCLRSYSHWRRPTVAQPRMPLHSSRTSGARS